MEIVLGNTMKLRRWKHEDALSLTLNANDFGVAKNLRDKFPHPYTIDDANRWIASNIAIDEERNFAIEVEQQAVGSIGIELGNRCDIHHKTGEIGYWLGRNYWRKGIMTKVLKAATDFFEVQYDLVRIQATVMHTNPKSAAVLEKSGYEFEGILKNYGIKNGELKHALMYAHIPDKYKIDE